MNILRISKPKKKKTKIFGIGMPKTGSTTLGTCFQKLGYNHRPWSPENVELIREINRGNFTKTWKIIENFDSFKGNPWLLIYKKIDECYPNSKFILTLRRNSETWWESLLRHVNRVGHTEEQELTFGFTRLDENKDRCISVYEEHNKKIVDYFAERKNKLLIVCWETGSGWEELCSFLEQDIPDIQFPHANKNS